MDERFHFKKKIFICLLIGIFFTACSAKKSVPAPNELDIVPSDSQRIENLSQTVSRMQSRIEELDAKLASMNDKIHTSTETIKLVPPEIDAKIDLPKNKQVNKIQTKTKTKTNTVLNSNKSTNTMIIDEITATFMKASSLFKDAKYSDAVIEFNKFTENYPEHILAGSAQFYIGESYFQLGEFKLAASEFEKTISVFPSSPRVVNAQIRLAQCLKNQGKNTDSEAVLANAKKLYSGNPTFEQISNQNVEVSFHKTISKDSVEKKKPTQTHDDVLVEETLPLEPMGLEQQPKTHE